MTARWDGETPLGELPARMAAIHPEREALVFGRERITFAGLADEVDRTTRAVIALGVQPGEKCVVWLNNCPEWIYLMFALARVGAVLVPANTRFRTDDVRYVIEQSEATTLFTHDVSGPIDYLAMVRELRSAGLDTLRVVLASDAHHEDCVAWESFIAAGREVAAATVRARAGAVSCDDTLFIMYTSGTTGFPKGVMRSHHLLRNESDRLAVLGTRETDVTVNYLPLFHIFGFVDGPLSSVLAGNCQVLMETFDAHQVLRTVEREGATQIQGFEAHLKALISAQRDLRADVSTLRCGVFAVGMQSAVEVAREALEVLAPLTPVTAYGMTEIGANCSLSLLDSTVEQITETSGKPCPGFEFSVVDPDTGEEMPAGRAGELWVRTYNIMQGYYRMPEATAAAFTPDGWFRTGDMGVMRDDGYFRLLGRFKDMLKIGGENVDPMEVERHLLTHPHVLDAAVIGCHDPRLTEVAAAFVVAEPGRHLTAADLDAHCRGRIASFKIPRHVWLVDTLPMTPTGKVRKVELREHARQRLADPSPRPSA